MKEATSVRRPASSARVPVEIVGTARTGSTDRVVTEEPLEIRIGAGGRRAAVAVTMRTPGNDFELAAGLLHSEGVVAGRSDIDTIRYCTDESLAEETYNVVTVDLHREELPDLRTLDRTMFSSSACGVCGKAGLDQLELRGCDRIGDGPVVAASVLSSLPERMRERQALFDKTGGLHAAALFGTTGELVQLREDVGRHNAVDKLVGWGLLSGALPFSASLLVVSGRTSFEIVQKALNARIPVVAGISAPSSLAIDVSSRFGMTLVGFLSAERFNVYAGAQRIS